nr:WYL domain-containing protein [Marinobacter oulmenensis]
MNPAELYALLACEYLLENVQPGLVAPRLAPLKQKIQQLLGESGHDAEKVSERIRIQPIQTRSASHQTFDPVAQATLSGKGLRFLYQARSGSGEKARLVHPQRLLHYRSNWYLLAMCETANELRLFSLDRIIDPEIQSTPARSVSPDQLDAFTTSGFGIFGGAPKATAHLRFSEHAAQWVAEETWHPDQTGQWQHDGYHLTFPYSDSRELVMDVLRYGPDVEVLGPPELRAEVADRVRRMAGIY